MTAATIDRTLIGRPHAPSRRGCDCAHAPNAGGALVPVCHLADGERGEIMRERITAHISGGFIFVDFEDGLVTYSLAELTEAELDLVHRIADEYESSDLAVWHDELFPETCRPSWPRRLLVTTLERLVDRGAWLLERID
ncbi:MAG TPA: hypothetical protein VNS09_26295 [Solirubrobacter sp.]|nr:hypothetical protein [Solirubrobacter sp.]